MPTIVAGSVEISAENRDRALSEAAQLMSDTRSEKGCRHYVWSADPTSETRIYIYEYWDNTEDFAVHLSSPYYSKMLAHMGSFAVHNVEVNKYSIDRQQPVYDPQGKARADFFDD
ncbi:MAG: putative quinol monooxygenase [Halioglobus sp.]